MAEPACFIRLAPFIFSKIAQKCSNDLGRLSSLADQSTNNGVNLGKLGLPAVQARGRPEDMPAVFNGIGAAFDALVGQRFHVTVLDATTFGTHGNIPDSTVDGPHAPLLIGGIKVKIDHR